MTRLTRRGVIGRWLFAATTTAVLVALGINHVSAIGRLPASLSQGPTVGVESQAGEYPSVSGDGRFVVYAGPPAVPTEDRISTVWLRDRSNGGEVELTQPVQGVRPGNSVFPVISGDGCYVAVITEMPYDLFRDDDTDDRWDVYRMKLPNCGGPLNSWELISTNAFRGDDPAAADDVDPRFPPAISGSGSVLAYTHKFDASSEMVGVIVVDLTVPAGQPGHALPVAGTPTEGPNTPFRYVGLREPSVSDDGQFVAFTSDANSSKPVADWSSGQIPGDFASSQVYVWDRLNPDPNSAVKRASLGPDSLANGDAGSPAISADGTYVAFQSTAVNLVIGASLPPCINSCPPQIYRYNRVDGTIVLVSRVPASLSTQIVGSDLGATQPAISSDGSQIAFITRSTNLLTTRPSVGGAASDGDVMVSNVDMAEIYRASVMPDGVTPAPAANAHPKLSSTGRVVVFDTLAGSAFSPVGAPSPTSSRQVVGITQQPQLSIADIDVGTGMVGLPGAEWFTTLYNAGPGSFVPSKVQSTNHDFGITFGQCVDGYAVPPGKSCGVAVILTPTVEGPISGFIKISESGFGALSVQARVTGAGGLPALTADQGSYHHFDTLTVGAASDPNTFTVSNVSFVQAVITRISLGGANPKDFKIVRTRCRNAVLEIAAGCTVDVAFTPKQAGHLSATVGVSTDTGQYTSFLVDGDAHYTPVIQAGATDVVAGNEIGIGGSGFAPSATVTLLWADGFGERTMLQTDKGGNFLISMKIAQNERSGDRVLVAQTPGAGTDPASLVLRIKARPVDEFDASSPEWPTG
ncbi:MAG TPA: choice-of-anchor D domain-containing protein [Ilumatobacteraceae bacterium]|nr:choice-of-anchor D domain-containing protein [Ilumatobacteraceae bacterium]